MPIWIHRLLGTLLQIAGFFSGGVAGIFISWLLIMAMAGASKPEDRPREPGGLVSVLGSCCPLLIGTPLVFGGAWLGRILSYGLFIRYVPARCSECRGRTYIQSENANAVRYRCRSCGHVYVGASWEE